MESTKKVGASRDRLIRGQLRYTAKVPVGLHSDSGKYAGRVYSRQYEKSRDL